MKMTINELRERDVPLNQEILNTIYYNPIIRDLPELAALYGLYGRFIVAEHDIYFAYGTDYDMVHGEFIEERNTVIPAAVVERCGYFKPSVDAPSLFGIHCAVIKINEYLHNNYHIATILKCVELIATECKKFHIPVPEYVAVSDITDFGKIAELKNVSENKLLKENPAKQSYAERELQFIKDIAVWEWPIRPNEKKPGLLAFSRVSRYSPNSADLSLVENVYNRPETWMKTFDSEATNRDCVPLSSFQADEANYIVRRLKEMKVPVRKIPIERSIIAAERKEQRKVAAVIAISESDYEEQIKKRSEYAYHRSDSGYVHYLIHEYTKTKFTAEELVYGNLLYYSSVDCRKKNEPNSKLASYLFYVPHGYIENFQDIAKRANIKYGYPDVPCIQPGWTNGVYLITEYSNMPLIDKFLHWVKHTAFTSHMVSIEHDAPYEQRFYNQNQISVMIRRRPWHLKKGKKILAKNLDGTSAMIPAEILSENPWTCAKTGLLKDGYIVDPYKKCVPDTLSIKSEMPKNEPPKAKKGFSFKDLLSETKKGFGD